MENPSFQFSADPKNTFLLQGSNSQHLSALLDLEQGELVLSLTDGSQRRFSLIEAGEPRPHAIRIGINSSGIEVLEVGEVGFHDQPLFLQDYPLNNSEIQSTWNLAGGHIGILDLRNIGRVISTHYEINRVPVNLSISGIHLRVATIRFDPDSGLTRWYEQVETEAE